MIHSSNTIHQSEDSKKKSKKSAHLLNLDDSRDILPFQKTSIESLDDDDDDLPNIHPYFPPPVSSGPRFNFPQHPLSSLLPEEKHGWQTNSYYLQNPSGGLLSNQSNLQIDPSPNVMKFNKTHSFPRANNLPGGSSVPSQIPSIQNTLHSPQPVPTNNNPPSSVPLSSETESDEHFYSPSPPITSNFVYNQTQRSQKKPTKKSKSGYTRIAQELKEYKSNEKKLQAELSYRQNQYYELKQLYQGLVSRMTASQNDSLSHQKKAREAQIRENNLAEQLTSFKEQHQLIIDILSDEQLKQKNIKQLTDLESFILERLEKIREAHQNALAAERLRLQTDLKSKISQLEKYQCKICLNNEISTVFLPCRHAVACLICGRKVTDCPICRTKITKKFDIYK